MGLEAGATRPEPHPGAEGSAREALATLTAGITEKVLEAAGAGVPRLLGLVTGMDTDDGLAPGDQGRGRHRWGLADQVQDDQRHGLGQGLGQGRQVQVGRAVAI